MKPINPFTANLIKKAAKKTLTKEERDENLKKFLEPSAVQMRLYHGTTATEGGKGQEAIRQFKPSKEGALGSGVYMTPKADYAGYYAVTTPYGAPPSTGGHVLPVYAQMRNPLVINGEGDPMIEALVKLGLDENKASRLVERAYENKGYIGKEVESRARAAGYDGLMQYRDGELAEVVSYNPSAIKSALGNEGTYDTSTPLLNKAEGGLIRMQGGGSPLDQFVAKSRGVSSLPGYGEGAQDIQQALAAIQEGPVGRIASGVGEFAEGYMSGAGSTDLQKIGQGLSMIPMLGLPATVSKTIKTTRVGDVITDSLRAKYPSVDISVAGDNTLYLGKMVVPKEQRNQGIGTQVMNDLVKQADDIGATVTLSPSADFGGNKEKLKEFYKRFGFVQNTGKNKDFSISESMYRTPQENLPTNFSDLGAMATQAYADYKANPNQLNALRYQRIKKAADNAYVKTQATPSKPVVTDEDYRGLHTAPTRSSGAPLHALTQTYPDDIYSSRASQYYGHGEPRDAAVVSLAQSFRDRPHQMVTVYRAVPKNAKGGINAGDWVTIDRPYAKTHGESALRGDYKILSKRVRANEIFTNGDSIYEWGYDPVEAIKKAAGGAIRMQDGGDPRGEMKASPQNPVLGAIARGLRSAQNVVG